MPAELAAWDAYAQDIASGRIVSCRWVKAAVQRHFDDLTRQGTDGFPYRWDPELASRPVEFIQQLSHTKGTWASTYGGKKTLIALEPWEQFIIAQIHGWRRADGYRRYTRAYIEVARKNGKTTLGAGLANYAFFADRPHEVGPEIYFAATKQEQAAIAWREARQQIRKNRVLATRAKSYESKQVIVRTDDESARMRPLGRDSSTEDGLNPYFALIDEYHAHPDSMLLDVIESGMGAREQPLTAIITTAGFDKNGPCFLQEHALAENILSGVVDPKPENCFAIIFTLDEGDDWANPRCWIKANPNLGISVKEDHIAERVRVALAVPAKQNEVKTKNLNIWTQTVTRWISDERWLSCRDSYSEDDLVGRRCYGGLDLSTVIDITAIALAFVPENPGEPWKTAWRFFMPEENILERERQDKVPYAQWAERGLIILTPGDVIDYDFIEQEIGALGTKFAIQEVAYDPWKAQEIVNHLSGEGFQMVQTPQRYNPMAIYCDIFEKKVLARELSHDGNPVMRWMMSCTELKTDRQGNSMPMKPRRESSGKRIDGVVASIMALGRGVVATGGDKPSVYEDRGIRSL